jgi:hypothetical protein
MMTTHGAATTLLGNIAGGIRPQMGHDGAAQDALIAVPASLFNALLGQVGGWMGNQIGQVGAPQAMQQQGIQGGAGHGIQGPAPYGAQVGQQAGPNDLIAVPAQVFSALLGQLGPQGGWGGRQGGPYADQIGGQFANQYGNQGAWGGPQGVGGIAPFQVLSNGALFR